MKKIIAGSAAILLAGGSVLGYNIYNNSSKSNGADIIKEVKVARGNVTSGITESAAVNVESLEQTYDLVLNSTSVSASVEGESSASGGSKSMGGGMSMNGGMSSGGMSSGGKSSGSKSSGSKSGRMGSTSV